MIDIIVIRDNGLVQGDDIVNPLISTLAAALARGEHELNETATGKIEKTLEIPYQAGIEPGQFVHVQDDFLLEDYAGKVENVDIDVRNSPPQAFIQLRLIVPEDFFNPSIAVKR